MEKYRDILERAFSAMDNAYAPYSNYHVGACVKTKDGNYVVTTSFPHDKWVYSFLLSFGSDVKVLEPEEIRINLLNEIEKIKKVYKE